MQDLDKKTFIIAFIKGYMACKLKKFENNDGKYILKRVKNMQYSQIERVAELNAIKCLMNNREYNNENFTLGEILNALEKTDQEAQKVKDDLSKLPSWSS